jgi:hypothetical protein
MIYRPDLQRVIAYVCEELATYDHRMDSPDARALLLATALHESAVGYRSHLYQYGGGPGRGLWQVEPATAADNWDSFIAHRPELEWRMRRLGDSWPNGIGLDATLAANLLVCCAHARLKYWRVPEPLPSRYDVEGQTRYWSTYYQTSQNPRKEAQFLRVAKLLQREEWEE